MGGGGSAEAEHRRTDTPAPRYRMDAGGAPAMLNSLMYRMCYYNFDRVAVQGGRPMGFDRVRNVEVGVKNIVLNRIDEAFTSENWIVRIYKVRRPPNRASGTYLANRGKRGATSEGAKAHQQQAAAQSQPLGAKYVGCVSSETLLGSDRAYGGGGLGANVRLAKFDAESKGHRYFAVARLGSDGHSFSFSERPRKFDVSSAGCTRPCLDQPDLSCGCADGACAERGDQAVPPEEHNRRWAVYEIQ